MGISLRFVLLVALRPAGVTPHLCVCMVYSVCMHVWHGICVCTHAHRGGVGLTPSLLQGLFQWLWNSAPRTDGLGDKATRSLDRARPQAVAMAGRAGGVCLLVAMRLMPTNVRKVPGEGSLQQGCAPACSLAPSMSALGGGSGHQPAAGWGLGTTTWSHQEKPPS